MNGDPQPAKRTLRRAMREAIRRIPAEERRTLDTCILDRAKESLLTFTPKSGLPPLLLAYMPLPDEIDLVPLLADCLDRDWCLCLPRIVPDGGLLLHGVQDLARDLAPANAWGIREPQPEPPIVEPSAVDLVLVPGLAFGLDGMRLGRGKGYYDRLLPRLHAERLALAYDCQVLETVPCGPSDERVHRIFTPTRAIECRP